MTEVIRTFEEYKKVYRESIKDPESFWERQANCFQWHKKWDKVLEWDFEKPDVKWFLNAKLNITENCIDRHLKSRSEKTALIWEPNDPADQPKKISYGQLHENVCRFANILKKNGIKKGDRVCIYMPMIPELLYATLACARVGAIHSVVFGGFSARSVADRINDSECKMVITADGMNRGKKTGPVKKIVDDALPECPSIEKVIVVNHNNYKVSMKEGRDVWLHDEWDKAETENQAESMDAEDMLFILYTSGSTGKPKGVVHTCGGYMVQTTYTFKNVFQYQDDEVYWCTADVGWITGHSYLIYGPLLAGATTLMFEGVPTFPDPGRFWQVVDRHNVNVFYTAPTAIRSLMAAGDEYVTKYRRQSLRVLGTVGEPINEEAWRWYHDVVGNGRCAVVDTWWQTETGSIMIAPIAGITPARATFATYPLPGVCPVLLDQEGNEIEEPDTEGYLAIRQPWPSVIRTTYGDHERCRVTYFAPFKGYYFTGDSAKRNTHGMYRIIGRVDDVINVSGHRIGTAEIENAINQHDKVVESAVVGYPHEIKGQGIYAFVIAKDTRESDESHIINEVQQQVEEQIGKVARPDKIQVVEGLPKTRSGKIMRRILRKIGEGDTSNLGDTSTLLDPEVVEKIIDGAKKENNSMHEKS